MDMIKEATNLDMMSDLVEILIKHGNEGFKDFKAERVKGFIYDGLIINFKKGSDWKYIGFKIARDNGQIIPWNHGELDA